ncbi:hypothetical protein KP509_1Z316400 [Ceratopteris richardii]|nr:hypothetical protein KP509_1Z316400 [Ceratopteris richardii]
MREVDGEKQVRAGAAQPWSTGKPAQFPFHLSVQQLEGWHGGRTFCHTNACLCRQHPRNDLHDG